MENLRPEFRPPLSPSQERAASPVFEEEQASPVVHCSQYRMEEYELQNGPLPWHENSEGRRLAPQRPGGVGVRRAVVLSNATRRPAQRINTSLTRTRSMDVRAGAAGDRRLLSASICKKIAKNTPKMCEKYAHYATNMLNMQKIFRRPYQYAASPSQYAEYAAKNIGWTSQSPRRRRREVHDFG